MKNNEKLNSQMARVRCAIKHTLYVYTLKTALKSSLIPKKQHSHTC